MEFGNIFSNLNIVDESDLLAHNIEKDLNGMTTEQQEVLFERLQQIWEVYSSCDQKWINLWKLRWDLYSFNGLPWDKYQIGSFIEVPHSGTSESDIDWLHTIRFYTAYNDTVQVPIIGNNIPFILESSGLHTGYYTLRVCEDFKMKLGKDTHDHNDSRYPEIRKFENFTETFGDKQLLSGELLKQFVHVVYTSALSEHFTARYDKGSTAIPCKLWGNEIDVVVAIRCPYWPQHIRQAFRLRDRKWPSKRQFETMMNNELYLVSKSHRQDASFSDCKWRLSFTLVEQDLFHAMSPKQRFIFCIAKALFKVCIQMCPSAKANENFALGSYVIKTIVFWEYESKESSWWDKLSLIDCVERIIQSTVDRLRQGTVHQFCVPTNNLIDSVTKEARFELANVLERSKFCLQGFMYSYFVKTSTCGEKFLYLSNLNDKHPSSVLKMAENEFQSCLNNVRTYIEQATDIATVLELRDDEAFAYLLRGNDFDITQAKTIVHSYYQKRNVLFNDKNTQLSIALGIAHSCGAGIRIRSCCPTITLALQATTRDKRCFLVLILKLALLAKLPLDTSSTFEEIQSAFHLANFLLVCRFFETTKYVCRFIMNRLDVHNLSKLDILFCRFNNLSEFSLLHRDYPMPMAIWPYIFYIRSCKHLGEVIPTECTNSLKKLYNSIFPTCKPAIRSNMQQIVLSEVRQPSCTTCENVVELG